MGKSINTSEKKHQPVVWVLSGHKAGDTSQMLALADALGWEYTVKQLRYRSTELFTSLFLGASLTGISHHESSLLAAPWPDLIITAGRRNEPVARWITRQNQGKTKIVHLGRPWAALDLYDLVITTPQYSLPERSNILHIALPLHAVNKKVLEEWKQGWSDKLPDLPRPWWVVLLGGDSGQFIFTEEKGRQLGQWVNQQASALQGSVLVTNSARTPAKTYATFLSQLTVPNYKYYWQQGSDDNPYRGYLSHADNLVVTGESMSMLAEAASTEVPLYLYDLADCPDLMSLGSNVCRPWWLILHNYRYKPLTHRLSQWLGPKRMRRDISRIQDELVKSGRAVWVGQALQGGHINSEKNLKLAVRRVQKLFE